MRQSLDETCVVFARLVPLQHDTESRSVMYSSVVAVVVGRNYNPDHLPLPARERTPAPHEFDVEVEVVAHYSRVYAMDAEDVVIIGNPVPFWDVRILDIGNEGHRRPSGVSGAESRRGPAL